MQLWMQDADYVLKTIKKQECYEKNGIFMGERLIVTQEAQGYVLNTEEIERLTIKSQVEKLLFLNKVQKCILDISEP